MLIGSMKLAARYVLLPTRFVHVEVDQLDQYSFLYETDRRRFPVVMCRLVCPYGRGSVTFITRFWAGSGAAKSQQRVLDRAKACAVAATSTGTRQTL